MIPNYEEFVTKRIMVHIVTGSNCVQLQRACELYGVDLKQFKEEHSAEIMFAMLKQ